MGMTNHPELPGVEAYLVKIGPDDAKAMLERNTKGQRSISTAAVERYAIDMASLDWVFNGAPILFSTENELLDGQHRLSAIVASGEPQIVLVVTGIDPTAMVTIDAGRKRSYADSLKIRGFSNHAALATIANKNWHWHHGNYGLRGVGRVADPKFLSSTPSNAQKDFWMDKVEKAYGITLSHAATFAVGAYQKRPGISASTYGLAWVVLSSINKDWRDGFFHELLVESKSPNSGYPIVALTNRLGRLKPNERFDPVDQLDAIFTAFNFWLSGREIKTLMPPRPVRWDRLAIPENWTELEDGK